MVTPRAIISLCFGAVHAVKAYGQYGHLTKWYETACKVVNFGISINRVVVPHKILVGSMSGCSPRRCYRIGWKIYATILLVMILFDTFKAMAMHHLKLQLMELMAESRAMHLHFFPHSSNRGFICR
jgi:hypothetical protein